MSCWPASLNDHSYRPCSKRSILGCPRGSLPGHEDLSPAGREGGTCPGSLTHSLTQGWSTLRVPVDLRRSDDAETCRRPLIGSGPVHPRAASVASEQFRRVRLFGDDHLHDGDADQHRRKSAARSHRARSEEHTSELQSRGHLVCRLLLEKKNK